MSVLLCALTALVAVAHNTYTNGLCAIMDDSTLPIAQRMSDPSGHGPPTYDSTTCPITFSTSSPTYTPGSSITITLMGTFRGVLFYITDSSNTQIGSFSNPSLTSLSIPAHNFPSSTCAGTTTMSHNINTDKVNPTVVWTAPLGASGPVQLKANFVITQSPSSWCFNVTKVIQQGATASPVTNYPTAPPSTLAPTPVGTVQSAVLTSSDGMMTVQWTTMDSSDNIRFTIIFNPPPGTTPGWFGVALILDPSAAAHSGMVSYQGWFDSQGKPHLQAGYSSSQAHPQPYPGSIPGYTVSSLTGSISGGVHTISFTRAMHLSPRDSTQFSLSAAPIGLSWAWTTTTDLDAQHLGRGKFTGSIIPNPNGIVETQAPVQSTFSPTPGPSPAAPKAWVVAGGALTIEWEILSTSIVFTVTYIGPNDKWFAFGLGNSIPHVAMETWSIIPSQTGSADLYLGYSNAREPPSNALYDGAKTITANPSGLGYSASWTRPLTAPNSRMVSIVDGQMSAFWSIGVNSDQSNGHPNDDNDRGSTSLNFLTGQQGVIVDRPPSWWLTTIMLALIALYAVLRWTKKWYKWIRMKICICCCAERMKEQQKKVRRQQEEQGDMNNYRENPLVQEGGGGGDGVVGGGVEEEEEIAVAVSGGLSRPPQKTDRYIDNFGGEQGDLYNYSVPANHVPNSPRRITEVGVLQIEEKKNENRLILCFRACLSSRVPWFHVPSYGFLAFLGYIGLNIGCLFFTDRTLANKFGSVAVANSLFIVLPATRNGILSWVLGISYDRVIVYHRWLGTWTVLLVLIHGILHYVDWVRGGENLHDVQVGNSANFWGLWAALSGVFLIVTSISWIRRNKFRFFYWSHFGFIAYYLFAYFHTRWASNYIIYTFAVYVFDRLVRFFWGFLPTKTILLRVKPGNILQVRFKKHPFAEAFGMYKVGQYVFLNFPGVSVAEWHPFSISSGPRDTAAEVHIRGLGDYTQKLIEHAHWEQSIWMRVDGPYGNHKLNYRRYPVILLIGGGIGISPVMGIIKDLYDIGDIQPHKPAPPSLINSIYVVWAIRKEVEYEWFKEELEQCMAKQQDTKKYPALNVWIYVTQNEGELQNPMFLSSRPNFELVFDTIATSHQNKSCIVFSCGPRPMVDETWDQAVRRTGNGVRYDFHHETFEF